jgi:hypothetical protein
MAHTEHCPGAFESAWATGDATTNALNPTTMATRTERISLIGECSEAAVMCVFGERANERNRDRQRPEVDDQYTTHACSYITFHVPDCFHVAAFMRCVARFAPPPTVTNYAALRDHGQHQPGNTPCQIRRFHSSATCLSALWRRAAAAIAVRAASRERGGGVSGAYKASARVLPQSHPCFDSRHDHTIVVPVKRRGMGPRPLR